MYNMDSSTTSTTKIASNHLDLPGGTSTAHKPLKQDHARTSKTMETTTNTEAFKPTRTFETTTSDSAKDEESRRRSRCTPRTPPQQRLPSLPLQFHSASSCSLWISQGQPQHIDDKKCRDQEMMSDECTTRTAQQHQLQRSLQTHWISLEQPQHIDHKPLKQDHARTSKTMKTAPNTNAPEPSRQRWLQKMKRMTQGFGEPPTTLSRINERSQKRLRKPRHLHKLRIRNPVRKSAMDEAMEGIMEGFIDQLGASSPEPPAVKLEEPDAPVERSDTAPGPSGDGATSETTAYDPTEDTQLAEMGRQVDEQRKRLAETARRAAEFREKEAEFEFAVPRRGRQKVSRSSDDDEKKDDPKAPLTTFGHSSRPRRSVNYASIERGDEAQSQSLVTEFTTGKKRPKRTRDELDENYEDSVKKKSQVSRALGNGRKFNNFGPSGSSGTHVDRAIEERRPEMEFAMCIPNVNEERPPMEQRAIGMKMETMVPIKRASGGFRKFVGCLTDVMIVTMGKIVEYRFNLNPRQAEDRKLLQTVRHVYNLMPLNYRNEWETAARMDVFDSRKIVPGLSMPLSEILIRSDEELQSRPPGISVRPNCCSMHPTLFDMRETAEHFLNYHDTVHLFGCDICYKLFTSRFDLTKHDCKEFTTYLLDLTMKGQTLQMDAAYMYLCCAQCGLWLSVKTSMGGMKGWPYFATALMSHTCQNLAPLVIYFRKQITEEGKNVRMSFRVMSQVDEGFPLRCVKCETDEFESVEQAEAHFKAKHEPFACQKCPKVFGTRFLWKHHQQTHVAQSAQFAHYLMSCATFHPPPGSGRRAHIGFNSEIPVYGGITADEVESLEACAKEDEFVEPDAPTLRRKMLKWKPTPQADRSSTETETESTYSAKTSRSGSTDSSSDSEVETKRRREACVDSDDSDAETRSQKRKPKPTPVVEDGPPGDLGYDHIDRDDLFRRETDEQEAMRRLEKLMNKHIFTVQDRLLGAKEVLEFLDKEEGEQVKEATLPVLSCRLADEIAEATVKVVQMPISNCVDPLKDFLLVNKIYQWCPKCKLVFISDLQAHIAICGAEEETILTLSHGAAGPQQGLRCIFPECTVRLCAASALRNHCSLVHDELISLESLVPSATEQLEDLFLANRYDRSIMAISKFFNEFQHDLRTPLARMTDVDCYLPPMGKLERRVSVRSPPDHLRRNGIPPPIASSAMASKAYLPPAQQQQPGGVVKPYKIPKTSRWFHCQFCEKEYETTDGFLEHISKQHVCACNLCGKAFSSLNTKRTHVCHRVFSDAARQRPGVVLTGECPECHERFSIDNVYLHMLKKHFRAIEYIQTTGEFIPHVLDVKLEPTVNQQQRIMNGSEPSRPDYRLKLVKVGGPPTYGVPLQHLGAREKPIDSCLYTPPHKKHIDTRLMCYLCEMTFMNVRELASHLDDHPEQWVHCPFCQTPAKDHFDMQKHLLEAHTYRVHNKLTCEFCRETLPPFAASHFIYRCKHMPCCTICGMRSNDNTANLLHLQRAHKLILKRFQCGYCPSYFISMSEYYDHQCSGLHPKVYSCSCSPEKFFSSASAFCDHYDSIHLNGNTCMLCGLILGSQEATARHRSTHMKGEASRVQQKRVFIISQWIFPKRDSGYINFMEHNGPPPPSFTHTDKTHQHSFLMGGSHTIPVTVAPPGHPVTLADALNGIQRNGGTVPGGYGQNRLVPRVPRAPIQAVQAVQAVQAPHQPPPSASSTPTAPPAANGNNDIIMLSDDDDDIVFEGFNNTTNTPKENNVTPQAAPSQITSQVRVEQSGTGYGGSQQPGYVDDDVEVQSEPRRTPEEPVVKQVEDENGDDELAVVAEVEHPTGSTSATVSAGREKKFKCTQCSLAFFTNSSLQHHLNGHRQDAGTLTTKETYGLPLTGKAWLCRNCCIAFESVDTFKKHMSIHGDTVHTCVHCSGIAFNNSTLQNHMTAHAAKSVNYACGTCMVKFGSDLALMDHLRTEHHRPLFYFCKVCGLGSTAIDFVFHHVLGHEKMQVHQRIGCCPTNLVNFEPADEQDLKVKVLTKMVQLETPSDCSHRTLLLSNDTLVACKDCFCTQAWFNFLAHNNHLDESVIPHFQPIAATQNMRGVFPLLNHLNPDNQRAMINNAKSTVVAPRVIAQVAKSTPQAPPTRATPTIAARRAEPAPRISAPLVSTTPNGARVVRPNVQANIRVNPAAGLVTNRNATTTPLQHPAPRRIIVSRPMEPTPTQNNSGEPKKCQTCNSTFNSELDGNLHKMHYAEFSWFCRQCGHAYKTEIELFMHYVKDHLNQAHETHASDSVPFKSCIFKLTCPIANCQEKEFAAIKAFEKHIRNAHSDLLPFEASCDCRFASKELCDQHDQKHNEYLETNGTDSQCCPLCGTLDVWSLPKDPATDCLLSHTIRHGLNYRSACRICLQQFPDDTHHSQVLGHIRDDHGELKNETYHCKVCPTVHCRSESSFLEHCRNAHMFNILVKSKHSQRGELVVTSEQDYCNYVGLKSDIARPPTLGKSLQQQRQQKRSVGGGGTGPSGSSGTAGSERAGPSTSSAPPPPSAPHPVTTEYGGNAALQSIAASLDAIGNLQEALGEVEARD